jgi:ADP-ribose pyrophosphatase YjhB (NUDIX family)
MNPKNVIGDSRARSTRLTCSVLLEKDGKLLLVQEGKETKAYGKWNQPAGHLDEGETPIDCAKREALEESGYKVKILSLIAVMYYREQTQNEQPTHIHFCFTARPIGKQSLKLADDVLQAKWFTKSEIKRFPKKDFRGLDTITRLELWLKKKKGIPTQQLFIREHKV